MSEIKINDFVWIYHPYSWEQARELGCLNPHELSNKGYIMGQVIGTYGPWDNVPNSTFHWSIVPDCWILAEYHPIKKNKVDYGYFGSCQLEPERVKKDIERTRNWELCKLTNNFESIINNKDPREHVIEKLIIKQATTKLTYVNTDTSGCGLGNLV